LTHNVTQSSNMNRKGISFCILCIR